MVSNSGFVVLLLTGTCLCLTVRHSLCRAGKIKSHAFSISVFRDFSLVINMYGFRRILYWKFLKCCTFKEFVSLNKLSWLISSHVVTVPNSQPSWWVTEKLASFDLHLHALKTLCKAVFCVFCMVTMCCRSFFGEFVELSLQCYYRNPCLCVCMSYFCAG